MYSHRPAPKFLIYVKVEHNITLYKKKIILCYSCGLAGMCRFYGIGQVGRHHITHTCPE